MTEEWRQIEGQRFYDVSSFGRVRSWNLRGKRRRQIPILLRPSKGFSKKRYFTVALPAADGKFKNSSLHVLVATAFHGPRPPGYECRHLDGDRSNNRADNLAWGTQEENREDKKRHGRSGCGEANAMALLSEAQVIEILAFPKVISDNVIAEKYGVVGATINAIRRGRIWKHVDGVRVKLFPLTSAERSAAAQASANALWARPEMIGCRQGMKNGRARLTESDVCEIKKRRADGERAIDLARAFGVTSQTVWGIVSGRKWKHLSDDSLAERMP